MPNSTLRHLARVRWGNMIQRCTNPNHPSWPDYGGRGITVCPEWLASFDAFYATVGDAPPGRSLDRPDNDGSYGPDNWRWATRSEQAANMRQTPAHNMRRKTHCPQGHEYTEANTYRTNGRRVCRACSIRRALDRYYRNKAQEPPTERAPHRNSLKTECPAGHPYDEENTYIRPNGSRFCRACNRERAQGRAVLKAAALR